jgi:deoxyribodipyrimidine photo-lyase
MRRVPDAWLFEPWRMPPEVQRHCGLTVGVDIPEPVVDLAQATRRSKAALHARRAEPEVRAGKRAVIEQHASRRVRTSARTTRTPPASTSQLGFDF